MFYMQHKGREMAAKVVEFVAKWLNLCLLTVPHIEDIKKFYRILIHLHFLQHSIFTIGLPAVLIRLKWQVQSFQTKNYDHYIRHIDNFSSSFVAPDGWEPYARNGPWRAGCDARWRRARSDANATTHPLAPAGRWGRGNARSVTAPHHGRSVAPSGHGRRQQPPLTHAPRHRRRGTFHAPVRCSHERRCSHEIANAPPKQHPRSTGKNQIIAKAFDIW